MGKGKNDPQNKAAVTALKNLSQEKPRAKPTTSTYSSFDQLDGRHPWQDVMPEGYVSYKVRQLKNGKVAYFNFSLAKEMGLIPTDHPDRLNKSLEDKICETFCLRIINEYDIENKIYYPKDSIKEHPFMATRYLQLQHSNKQGKTSGDGRCIWNGAVIHKGKTWDVSSRGTGVTQLAPGAVEAGEPLKSGNEDFGYGCGLAEIDELYSSAIMAEIFHCNNINTERMLAIIDLGGGYGIGVRAGLNLLRPAHMFLYLKQENRDALKRATDYFILRQIQNKEWDFSFTSSQKYNNFVKELTKSFAEFAAHLEREYIFAWLDWDGDNVLGTAGIIDYGSVRQFGLRHDQYRYDDVERFSTNLNEQRAKARLTVQVFLQQIDFLQTGRRRPLEDFKDSPQLANFDNVFHKELKNKLLIKWGFNERLAHKLLKHQPDAVEEFFKNFELLEKTKTHKKLERVADGVNRPAIFNMRKFIRYITLFACKNHKVIETLSEQLPFSELFHEILAEGAVGIDKRLTPSTKRKIKLVTENFCLLVLAASTGKNRRMTLESVRERAHSFNPDRRVTGNSLLYIVNEIMAARKKGVKHQEIQKIMDNFIASQTFHSINPPPKTKILRSSRAKALMTIVEDITQSHDEDI